MQFLWRYIDELVGKGLDFSVIAEFLLYTSATLVPMALPLSILMSSLMTFGNLGEKYELTAIKASGISLQKIMRPLVILVFLVSLGTFFFANNVLPYANLRMRSLLYDIRQQRPELQLKPGQFNNLIDGYSIRINDKDPKTNTMFGIQIYDHSQGKGNINVIYADSATMQMTADEQSLLMTLHHGHSYSELQDMKVPEKKRSYPHRYDKFEKQEILMSLTGFNFQRTDQNLFKNHYAMMDIWQLEAECDSTRIEISNKENGVYKSIVDNNLFKKRTKNTPPKKRPTSIEKKKTDSLANSQNIKKAIKGESDNVIPSAKNSVKNKIKADTSLSPPEQELPLVKTTDTDSIFACLTLREKSKVANDALSYARTSKNLIVNSLQSLNSQIHTLRRYEIEWHRKFTIAFACLVFLFIGAPLGAIIRKGGLGLPLVLSVLFFIIYYILSLTSEKLVRESIVPAYQGMWVTSFLFSIAGSFLTYQATTDSSMLNIDTYLNFLKKYFGQRYNIVDTINLEKGNEVEGNAKLKKIQASLFSVEESIDQVLVSIKNKLRITDLISSIFTPHNDSEFVLFDRYYNNTFRIIINHPIFHEKTVRAKIYDFPSYKHEELGDKKWILIIRIILACTIILTPLVLLRQYLKILMVRIKFRKIKSLLPELSSIISRYESHSIE